MKAKVAFYSQEYDAIALAFKIPSRHNESCLTMAQYCPGRGQYCAIVRQKTQVPNNGMSCRPETLARGRLEADYYNCALLEQKSYRQAHRR